MSEPEFTAEGRCTCGQVRYRMKAKPMIVNCCHCRWCQRETGSAFIINAMIESYRLERLDGDVIEVKVPSESGKGQRVFKCANCRVTLWSHYAGGGENLSFVRVGTLENPDQFPPDVHLHTESKQPWVLLPDDVPVYEGRYDPKQVWPAESLGRLESLFG